MSDEHADSVRRILAEISRQYSTPAQRNLIADILECIECIRMDLPEMAQTLDNSLRIRELMREISFAWNIPRTYIVLDITDTAENFSTPVRLLALVDEYIRGALTLRNAPMRDRQYILDEIISEFRGIPVAFSAMPLISHQWITSYAMLSSIDAEAAGMVFLTAIAQYCLAIIDTYMGVHEG